jgi:hypothetical protein
VFPVGNNYNKRSIRRLDYAKHDLSAVFFETTGGGLDMDCSIMFTVAGSAVKIDVVSDQQPFAARVYTCLVALCRQQQKNLRYLEMTNHMPAVHIALPQPVSGQPVPNPAEVTSSVLGGWIHYCVSNFDPENYAVVFQQFFP